MQIISFSATKVHGYLQLKVRFFKRLTFLTGINGSGKTTVLRGIVALTRPSLIMLARTDFEKMAVEAQVGARRILIRASKTKSHVRVRTNRTKGTLVIPLFRPNEDEPSFRVDELETEFYQGLEAKNQDNLIFKFLRSLPNPMFLGLERRGGQYPGRRTPVRRRPRQGRAVFSASILQSIAEAAQLAERAFREAQASNLELTEKLRKDIILAAFDTKVASGPELMPSSLFKKDDITRREQTLKNTLAQLGLDMTEVNRRVEPYFAQLKYIAREGAVHRRQTLSALIDSVGESRRRTFVDFMINRAKFRTIEHILKLLEEYSVKRERIYEKINFYLSSVNKFLGDSNKNLRFSDAGYLEVELHTKEMRDVSELSSGESQIFVIATHLMFNPLAKDSSVLIIDEPELSLHLRWQELFVSTVQEIDKGLQLILATHSPEIVNKNDKFCVDLSK